MATRRTIKVWEILVIITYTVWVMFLGIYMFNKFSTNTIDLHSYKEIQCNDIVRVNNANTHKSELVCEITMQQEDDNIRVFKGDSK